MTLFQFISVLFLVICQKYVLSSYSDAKCTGTHGICVGLTTKDNNKNKNSKQYSRIIEKIV